MRNKLMALVSAAFLFASVTASAMPNSSGGPGNTQHVKPPSPRVGATSNVANPGCGTRPGFVSHTPRGH